MRKILTLIFTLITLSLFSQIYNPVSWEFSQSKISDSEIELQFKGLVSKRDASIYIPKIYQNHLQLTVFTFIKNGDTSIKVLEESESIQQYDPNFDMILKYFSNEIVFKHNIKIQEGENFKIEGYVDFMVCDDGSMFTS